MTSSTSTGSGSALMLPHVPLPGDGPSGAAAGNWLGLVEALPQRTTTAQSSTVGSASTPRAGPTTAAKVSPG